MKKKMIYVHGKNGNADESRHYDAFFPEYDVIGFDGNLAHTKYNSRTISYLFQNAEGRLCQNNVSGGFTILR